MIPLRAENHEGRPPAREAASNVVTGDAATLPRRIDNFLHDTLLDVLVHANRQWWLRRAEEFEAARPRPDEFHGNASREELRARWIDLTEIAQACRARAGVAPVEDFRGAVTSVLREAV